MSFTSCFRYTKKSKWGEKRVVHNERSRDIRKHTRRTNKDKYIILKNVSAIKKCTGGRGGGGYIFAKNPESK